MKIGIVIWDLTVSGGAQRQAIELARELSKSHEVQVFCYAYDKDKCFPDLTAGLGINSLATKIPPFEPRPSNKIGAFLYDSRGQFRLFEAEIRRLAASISPDLDVLNAHDTFMERVAYHYKLTSPNVRTVWMSNDSPAIFLALDHDKHVPSRRGSVLKLPARLAQKALYAQAQHREVGYIRSLNAVVVLDRRNKRQVDELMHKKALIVRSGLDINNFTPKPKRPGPVFKILGTGILYRHRRFEDLIAAVGLLVERGRKVHLNIIGKPAYDPDYARELTQLTSRLRVEDDVSFLGAVSEEELLRQYREADVFVFPNHNQTWGLAVFEAMASGTPVVVSRTAGAHEVLADEQNALLVDPLQPEQIARKVEELMDNAELRDELTRKGRAFVEENITWKKYAENMERVFEGRS